MSLKITYWVDVFFSGFLSVADRKSPVDSSAIGRQQRPIELLDRHSSRERIPLPADELIPQSFVIGLEVLNLVFQELDLGLDELVGVSRRFRSPSCSGFPAFFLFPGQSQLGVVKGVPDDFVIAQRLPVELPGRVFLLGRFLDVVPSDRGTWPFQDGFADPFLDAAGDEETRSLPFAGFLPGTGRHAAGVLTRRRFNDPLRHQFSRRGTGN
jgi:hypothetical protein